MSVVGGLVFGGWDVFQDAVQTAVVVPVDPFHRWVLDVVEGSQRRGPKRATQIDCLGLEQPDRGPGQGVILGVPTLPIDAAMPSRTRVSAMATEVYCDLASVRWINPSLTVWPW